VKFLLEMKSNIEFENRDKAKRFMVVAARPV
jgi:hypothetical protein